MNTAQRWLETHGDERRKAADEAASMLLKDYRQGHPRTGPVNLWRLAHSLRASIQNVETMEGEARLVPVQGGFLIMVDDGLRARNYSRYRTAIAHELAHTLFYSDSGRKPERILQPSDEEETFCFDVARRLLVPKWMLSEVGLMGENDAEIVFKTLTKVFRLSWPVASRIMLEDYLLVPGIAGRWARHGKRWKHIHSEFYCDPRMSSTLCDRLQKAACSWLEKGNALGIDCKLLARVDPAGDSAFVIVQLPPSKNSDGLRAGVRGTQQNLRHWRTLHQRR